MTIEYDRDYGIDKRSGWSIAIGGSYYVQFWPEPVTALVVALWRWQRTNDSRYCRRITA